MECAKSLSRTQRMALVAVSGGCAGWTVRQAADEWSIDAADLRLPNEVTVGRAASGTVQLRVRGEELKIEADARGIEPGIAHLQHYPCYPVGRPKRSADANNDRVIELLETEPAAGDDTSSLTIQSDTLRQRKVPKAESTTSKRSKWTNSRRRRGKSSAPTPSIRVVARCSCMLSDTMPASHRCARLLPGRPAQKAFPIACGEIRQMQ